MRPRHLNWYPRSSCCRVRTPHIVLSPRHHAVLTPTSNQVTDTGSRLIRHHVHTFHVVSTTSRYYVTSLTGTPHARSGDESCQLM
ncbi:hypothetical protein F2Q70_00043036 [Brassica cretica]|uniref:Uncharacterized protein n=1 Tax=Brassica cretica TaxID=69181 RepID=A0A8S9LIR2_BRACR|nr:hypothetical protein F2Q70_00043036 [Brassica cretica]KAF2606342.1 hypothetical protein F2Q68_00044050 [Brassica cretica]